MMFLYSGEHSTASSKRTQFISSDMGYNLVHAGSSAELQVSLRKRRLDDLNAAAGFVSLNAEETTVGQIGNRNNAHSNKTTDT